MTDRNPGHNTLHHRCTDQSPWIRLSRFHGPSMGQLPRQGIHCHMWLHSTQIRTCMCRLQRLPRCMFHAHCICWSMMAGTARRMQIHSTLLHMCRPHCRCSLRHTFHGHCKASICLQDMRARTTCRTPLNRRCTARFRSAPRCMSRLGMQGMMCNHFHSGQLHIRCSPSFPSDLQSPMLHRCSFPW